MFAQVLEPWQNYFVGVFEGRGFRSEFDMIHLKKIPPHCKHLSGNLLYVSLSYIDSVHIEGVIT